MALNPTLKGHKLFIAPGSVLAPGGGWATPQERIDDICKRFPDLEVIYRGGSDWQERALSNAELKDVTILLSDPNLPTVDHVPKLAYVQLISAGANRILSKPIFTETNIIFCTANGVHGPQISEWVISTFLAFQHHLPRYLELQRQGRWERNAANTEDAVSKRVGLLGYGAIGRQTARVSKAMGMDVHAYTLHPKNTPEARRDNSWAPPGLGDDSGIFPSKWFSGCSKQELHDFLDSGLDLLVIAVPLTEKTRHLIGREELAVLGRKKRAFISNIGRGEIIVTEHLIEALEGDVIRGAALDVTDPEPLTEGHLLWSTKNTIITPHVSGNTTEYLERVMRILEDNLRRLSEGKELINVVDRKEGY